MPFDRHIQTLYQARHQIGDGWLLQYRGTGLISRAIQSATGSVHSHSALCQVVGFGEIDVLELREWVGGRRRTLEWHVRHYGGQIDVFAPNAQGRWSDEWRPDDAVELMRRLCDQNYGYWAVAKLLLRRIPGLWRCIHNRNFDVVIGKDQPFCSHAVALAVEAGGIDPVPHLAADLVTPGRLTTSLFFEYQFTIAGDLK